MFPWQGMSICSLMCSAEDRNCSLLLENATLILFHTLEHEWNCIPNESNFVATTFLHYEEMYVTQGSAETVIL
jgi:hypothetical protein